MDLPSIAASIPFRDVCQLFEKISEAHGGKAKQKKLQKFCDHFRKVYINQYGTMDPMKANNDSLFCIIRLLIPHEDQSRPPFGLKAVKLSVQLPKILGLDPGTPDGKKFLRFKDPRTTASAAGDLSKIVETFLQARVSQPPANPLMLAELHEILDKIAQIFGASPLDEDSEKTEDVRVKKGSATAVDRQRPLLQNLFRRLSPIEGKWLTRILLRRLDLGIQKSAIFNCLHEKAQELYGRVGDLEAVCIELNDPSATLRENEIGLFRPFNPMLCGRIYSLDTEPIADFPEEASHVEKTPRRAHAVKKASGGFLPNPPFLIENKFDGERMQIHFDAARAPHDQFRYYTRSRREYAKAYVNLYTPRLRAQVHPQCKSFILDGEMMIWSLETRYFVQKALGPDLRRSWADHLDLKPTYVTFDLVYFNGQNLENMILEERMEILMKKQLVVEPKEGVIVLSEQQLVEENGSECVRRALHAAVENCEEGLIVKNCRSKYGIGKRGQAWVKIKPEFFPEHSNCGLDVIVLGGYFTKSQSRGGLITSFLVGVLNDESIDSGGAGGRQNQAKFYAIAKVGPGHLKNPELFKLVEDLRPNFIPKSKIPSAPERHIKFDGRPRPDFYIEPQKSIVVTIRASQIILSGGAAATVDDDKESAKALETGGSFSLNFCRIFCVRREKTWRDILTFGQLRQLYHANKSGRLTKLGDDFDESGPTDYSRLDDSPSPSSSSKMPPAGAAVIAAKETRKSASNSPDWSLSRWAPKEVEASSSGTSASTAISPHASPSRGGGPLKKIEIPSGGTYKSPSKFKRSSSSSPTMTSPKKVAVISHALDNKVFMVIGSTDFVTKVTTDIQAHGGQVVQNKTWDLFAIVAEKVSPKVERLMKTGDHPVVKETWLHKCIETGGAMLDKVEPQDSWRIMHDEDEAYDLSTDDEAGSKKEKYCRHDDQSLANLSVTSGVDEGKNGKKQQKKKTRPRVLFDDSEEED